MKVSFVSSQAISQAMRYQMLRVQSELVSANKEVVTGRAADIGLLLGARTGLSVSFHREVDRLKGLIDSNQLAAARLESTQLGLRELSSASEMLLSTLTTALAAPSSQAIAKHDAEATLSSVIGTLNGSLNGEFLFAGINTDVKPLADFLDPASPSRQAFDAAFQTHFGFAPDDAAAASITTAQMEAFLDLVEPQFLGADWNALWSTATDQQITSRITLSETAQTSVSANITGVRKLAMAAAIVAVTFAGPISDDGRSAVLNRSMGLLDGAINEFANQQGQVGITEQRIHNANERMSMQADLFAKSLGEMEGVDPYEAATRVSGLTAQIELSYSLTARMQQLSLLRFLS